MISQMLTSWKNLVCCREYDITNNNALSRYCQSVSCYGGTINNSTFMVNDCDNNLCKTVTPTVPANQNSHWFFDYALYIGGSIHLLMSLAMLISYLLINAANFVLPSTFYKYMQVANIHSVNIHLLYKRNRLRRQRTSTYSDEPLLGLRSLYHIVRVTA